MKSNARLNTEVLLAGTAYTIIGIDNYSLSNILEKTVTWTSYTLIDRDKNKAWISGPYDGKFVQWSLISKEDFIKETKAVLNLELTGIANIRFEGNPGYSTPTAEIVWLNTSGKFDYIASERFIKLKGTTLETDETYFNAGYILDSFSL